MNSETRTVGVILDDAVARTGWNDGTQIEVLLDYVARQGDNAAFAAYMAERVEGEEAL